MLGELLRRLDDRALRDYAIELGLTSELELEEAAEPGEEPPRGR
jgi:hypothetical protein